MKYLKLITVLIIAVFFVLNSPSTASADDRGLTGIDPTVSFEHVLTIPAVEGECPAVEKAMRGFYLSPWMDNTDEWELIASDSITIAIPEGLNFAVFFDPTTEDFGFIDPTVVLTATQMEAIERAPAWLRADLFDNFRRFDYTFTANLVANEILNAPDPYVDEVAFQAAHIAPDVLEFYTYVQLLLENAQGVYSVDSALNYVEIIDYGDSNDDDYWSTTRYTIIEESGDTVQVEIDRETYYWYVVHPKLSDELPTYIDPSTGLSADPPVGVFWRDYLWNYADPGYPLFSEQFEGCDFLWAHLTNTAGPANGAIGVVNDWINDVMNFGAGIERPIQPVRIYMLHRGNCGEFSDITAAAGRIALIPTICTTNYCEDHTWNEFWDREWIAWEPVNTYVNYPLVYEIGWGKVLSAVFNWRGDGYVWTVTDRYSEGVCTLNVTIYDSLGKPADGERITIQSNAQWGGYYYATWGVTNSAGEVSFVLGDDQNFYLRIDGPLGSYPSASGTVINVISGSVAGTNYLWDYSMSGCTPDFIVAEAPAYPNPDDDYMMEIDYLCEFETVYGTIFINNQFAKKMDTGILDFFIANEDNYNAHNAFDPAEGFSIMENTVSGDISFVLPTQDPWYGIFSSRELSINRPTVTAVVNIYRNTALTPPVSVALTPLNPPIVIPANGGPFDFNIELTNNDSVTTTFDVWTMATLPSGDEFGPIIGPLSLTFPPGFSANRDRTQAVPAGAPSGDYTYDAYVGNYPDEIIDEDHLDFVKLAVSDGGFLFADWNNWGESFEELTGTIPISTPVDFALHAPYPNPFNPVTVLSFELRAASFVELVVYDVLGREVARLVDGFLPAGFHQRTFDGAGLSSGIYFIKLEASGQAAVARTLLMK